MTAVSEHDEKFAVACQQVGRFFYHFSLVEQKIDEGIGKILDIEGAALSIVIANIDFVRKVNVLRCSESSKAAIPDKERKKFLQETFSGVLALNEQRKIVAHCPFYPGKDLGSVIFRRTVATKNLNVENVEWRAAEFGSYFQKARNLTKRLEDIVQNLVPYSPSLDFSDPRNSMYLGII